MNKKVIYSNFEFDTHIFTIQEKKDTQRVLPITALYGFNK